jgi:hypothetical protein
LPASRRRILRKVGVGSLPQPNEDALASLKRKRLDKQGSTGSTSTGDALVDSSAELAASLKKMNSFSVGIHGQELRPAGWLDARRALEDADFKVPIPAFWRSSFAPKPKRGYARTILAVTVVSAAVLGLAGYALFTHDDGGPVVAAEPLAPPRAAPEDASKGGDASKEFEAGPTMLLAAIAAANPKPSGPLQDERSEPLAAKPESLARSPDTFSAKAVPAGEEGGAPETATPKAASRTVSKATEGALMGRASRQLSLGDVAGARTIFKSLAYQGSAKGAFALAETYDDGFLRSHNVIGMKADPKLAREWYEKAASLGSESAVWRLGMLN